MQQLHAMTKLNRLTLPKFASEYQVKLGMPSNQKQQPDRKLLRIHDRLDCKSHQPLRVVCAQEVEMPVAHSHLSTSETSSLHLGRLGKKMEEKSCEKRNLPDVGQSGVYIHFSRCFQEYGILFHANKHVSITM